MNHTPRPEPAPGEVAFDAASLPVDDALLAALHSRLESRAADLDLVDLAYSTVDSPVGPLLLATSSAGLARVAFARQDFDLVLEDAARRLGSRVLRSPGRLDEPARQLDEYFEGQRRTFDLPLDHRLSHGFAAQVQAWLPQIGYGQSASYAEVAQHVGSPRAVRAVGTACARNPLPIIVPCHRVVRSDGSSGQYVGGPEAKLALLELEGA